MKKYVYHYGFLSLIGFILFCRSFYWYDPDSFWHIKGGMQLLDYGFPNPDHLSWIAEERGHSWMMHEWLTDVTFGAGYRAFGENFIFLLCLALYLFLFITIVNYLNRHMEKFYAITAVVISFVILFNYDHGLTFATARPQLISYCLFVLLLCRVQKFKITISLKDYTFIFFMMIAWVNLHGGASLIGIAVLGLFGFCEAVLYFRKIKEIKSLLHAVGLLIVGSVSELLNPYGYKLFIMAYHTMYDPISKNISEWKPPAFVDFYLIAMLFLPFVLLLINWGKKIRIDLFSFLLVGIMLYEFLTTIRHGAMYIFAVVIMFAELWDPFNKMLRKCYTYVIESKLIQLNFLKWSMSCFILILAVLMFMSSMNTKRVVLTSLYPVKAIEWMKQNQETERIYNSYNWGGYMIFNNVKTFVDGRTDIFMSTYNQSNVFQDYLSANKDVTELNRVIDEYGVERFLLSVGRDKSLISTLSVDPRFNKVYQDNVAVLFKREGDING